uniref:Uncharacterized protein n=1 Tax=Apteryx owenii TaxID=8824 RepID=A0A8B9PZ33_APTOW
VSVFIDSGCFVFFLLLLFLSAKPILMPYYRFLSKQWQKYFCQALTPSHLINSSLFCTVAVPKLSLLSCPAPIDIKACASNSGCGNWAKAEKRPCVLKCGAIVIYCCILCVSSTNTNILP